MHTHIPIYISWAHRVRRTDERMIVSTFLRYWAGWTIITTRHYHHAIIQFYSKPACMHVKRGVSVWTKGLGQFEKKNGRETLGYFGMQA